jgi:hypothetical protein
VRTATTGVDTHGRTASTSFIRTKAAFTVNPSNRVIRIVSADDLMNQTKFDTDDGTGLLSTKTNVQ